MSVRINKNTILKINKSHNAQTQPRVDYIYKYRYNYTQY